MGFFDSLFGGNSAQQSTDPFNTVTMPSLEDLRVNYEQLKSQGQMTPELEAQFQQQASEMQNISTDPRLKSAQMAALAKLGDIGENGMTLQDQANLNKIQTQQGAAERGSREAILQSAARKGQSGSGVELAAMLANQQGSANRAADQGTQVAAQAQDRALQAIIQGGQLGGQIQNQDFTQQSAKAQAQDAINRFNTQNSQQVNSNNTTRINQGREMNLNNAQKIADQNVGIRNQQQQQNIQNQQTIFDNKIKRAGGSAGVSANNANATNQQNQVNAQQQNNLIGTGLTAAAIFSDKNLKENVDDFDVKAFLDSLSPKSYNYKDEKFGKGPQVGVMQQDMEKHAPQMVVDTPEGKMIDYNKGGGPLFASLADVNDRLKKLEGKN